MTDVERAIEAIGFGPAQIITQVLAHGIWVADGVELTLMTALTASVGQELQLSQGAMASLSSLAFLGIALGCGVSGYLGDCYGRRLPILACYLGIAIFATACSMAHHFTVLLVLRFMEGVFMGMGMPASLTLVSEMSPVGWRVPLMALRGVAFATGNIIAALILLLDDPAMKVLHWRLDVMQGVLPCSLLGILAICNLQESAVFLAKASRTQEAKQVLCWMRRMNSCYNDAVTPGCLEPLVPSESTAVNHRYTPPSPRSSTALVAQQPKSLNAQFTMIFSPRLIRSTIVLCFASFALNFNEYGIAYAEPRLLPSTHGPMPPAWLLLVKYVINIPVRLCVAVPAAWLGRQMTLAIGLFALASGVLLFSQAIDHAWNPLVATEYFLGQYLPLLGIAFGWIGTYQLSVETFPTSVAVTGSGLVCACGRLGAILAPYMFEYLPGGWRHFYMLMALLATMAAVLSAPVWQHAAEQDSQQEKSCA